MQNHSYENDFDLHENETACRTHFHMKGFALRLVLKQMYKRTHKWPIMLPSLKTTHKLETDVQYNQSIYLHSINTGVQVASWSISYSN